MNKKIINRVANSGLITIDLLNYASNNSILEFDLKDLLFKESVLKEKEFRLSLKEFDFKKYKNKTVALYCSVDAVIPMWAYMLVSSYLNPVCSEIYFGKKQDVFQKMLLKNIRTIFCIVILLII